ncbi:MAG: IclR family transcriptional regulator C-terminal domain-containing protein [Pseudomonadota bacterium]
MSESRKDSKGSVADPLYVASFGKILQVLRAFSGGASSMGLTEISQKTGFNISAVQRFIYTLEKEGLVRRWQGGRRYCLAANVIEPGFCFHQSSGWLPAAWAPMGRLASDFQAEAELYVLDGGEVISLGGQTGGDPASSLVRIGGRRMPAYCTAAGRILLSARSDEEIRTRMSAINVTIQTPKTLISPGPILSKIQSAALLGYAIVDQEINMGEVAVAGMIRDPDPEAGAALSLTLSRAHWTLNQVEEKVVPALLAATKVLSQQRGVDA